MRWLRVWLTASITGCSITLTGCMLGPDFRAPAPPTTPSYTEAPLPLRTTRAPHTGKASPAQTFVYGAAVPERWWESFHSPAINALVQLGLNNNPTIAAAKATLVEAKENVNVQIGLSLFPQVSTTLSGERQQFNSASFGQASTTSIFNLYNASVNVAYTFDLFGSARRQIEALRAQVDYEQYELAAAYLTLTSNIVATAISVAAFDAQVKATESVIRYQENALGILKKQLALGGIAGVDVLTQQTQVEQARATLPPLLQQRAQAMHLLSVLVGSAPSDVMLPTLRLDALTLPANLPVTLPSQWVQQRPDIQASVALLHVANANVGVATANLFPQITLNAAYGWQSVVASQLFHSGSTVWSWGGSLLQPIFEGGALHAKRRSAIAAFEAAEAQYRLTVLQAFQNVADTLRALQNDAMNLKAQKAAEIAAKKSLDVTTQQFRLGGVNYLSLLTAERQYQLAIVSRIQAQGARYADTVALFQALGGDWWHAPVVTQSA